MAEANHRIADEALSVLRHPLPFLGGLAGRLPRWHLGALLARLAQPIAMACFRLVTFRPELLFNVPFFLRRIADSTRLLAPLPYLAMRTSGPDLCKRRAYGCRRSTENLLFFVNVGEIGVPSK